MRAESDEHVTKFSFKNVKLDPRAGDAWTTGELPGVIFVDDKWRALLQNVEIRN